MAKHVNTLAVNRTGLVRRYARLRGVSPASAEAMTRDWSRTDLRETVERIENEETAVGAYVGLRQSWLAGRTTSVQGITR